jgi:DsbC/DsbD-like thiol-disulfide interchange protein
MVRRVPASMLPHAVKKLAAGLLFVQAGAGLLFVQPIAPAAAADASGWDRGLRSAVRLIAASAATEGGETALRAGVEIKLDKGWKTYWRYPGDSGIPPRFDFKRSQNVKTIAVRWPAPHRFSDEGGQSIGYKDHVILPLSIVPADPSKPVMLRLDLDYAICEKLCVPAEGKAELALTRNRTANEAALAAAEARVPKPAALGASSTPAISAVTRETASPPRIIVDVAAPRGAALDLFAEGPTPEWALPLPAPIAGAPAGVQRFAFALDGLPTGASAAGATLKLTAVADDAAVEVTYRLE